mmetsp:Transcript_9078/g.14353  ORF Transcript_9078/g.14353 Transcript_9078/m.14353 type:complete len:254 (-) Transcript_9078:865-1626(-)
MCLRLTSLTFGCDRYGHIGTQWLRCLLTRNPRFILTECSRFNETLVKLILASKLLARKDPEHRNSCFQGPFYRLDLALSLDLDLSLVLSLDLSLDLDLDLEPVPPETREEPESGDREPNDSTEFETDPASATPGMPDFLYFLFLTPRSRRKVSRRCCTCVWCIHMLTTYVSDRAATAETYLSIMMPAVSPCCSHSTFPVLISMNVFLVRAMIRDNTKTPNMTMTSKNPDNMDPNGTAKHTATMSSINKPSSLK